MAGMIHFEAFEKDVREAIEFTPTETTQKGGGRQGGRRLNRLKQGGHVILRDVICRKMQGSLQEVKP